MTSKAESLAEAIMKMAEEDKGLVKSKLVELVEAHANQNCIVELSRHLREQREKEALKFIKTYYGTDGDREFFQDAIATGTGATLTTVKDDQIEFRPLTHEELYGYASK